MMSRAQRIALLVIWLGILGSIAAVLFSWRVRREWLEPGGYMLVRRNLLTSEQDVLVNGQWVPLQGFTKSGPKLMVKQPSPPAEPPEADPGRPALPMRAPAPGALQAPQQAEVPPAPPIRPRAPVRVKAKSAPSEAVAPPVAAEDDQASSAPGINPDIPIVRAPSPDDATAVQAPPSSPPDEAASRDDRAAASAPDRTQHATAPACDPTAPGAVC